MYKRQHGRKCIDVCERGGGNELSRLASLLEWRGLEKRERKR